MSSDRITPPDPELAAMLVQLRSIDPAPADARTRARARLFDAVAGLGGSAPTAEPPGGRHGALTGKVGVASIAFLAGGVFGAGLYAAFAAKPAPEIVYVDRPVLSAQAPAPSAALSPAPPPPSMPPPAPSSTATSAPISSGQFVRSSQLSAERVVLDGARAALAQGDPQRALDQVERHRRTFAAPILGEERDALRVEALAKADRDEEARVAAVAFHKRWPDSLFASAVDAAVGAAR
jgi:hypothetical protein